MSRNALSGNSPARSRSVGSTSRTRHSAVKTESATAGTKPNGRLHLLLLAVLAAFAMTAASCGSGDDSADESQDPAASTSDTDDSDGAEAADAEGDTEGDSETADSEESDAEGDGAMASAEFPVTIDSAAGEVVIAAQPTAIVSLSPTATEMAYAIGAGDQIAAVDTYSNYPPEAPEGTLDGFSPDLEAILAASPDLVLTSGLPEDISAGLTAAEVPVLVLPAAASFDDTYDQIGQLGIATGHIDGAADANASLRSGIEEVLASLPESEEPVKVFHEIDDSFYTATSASFIGQVYAELGFENIADAADDGSGFPLIDGETIISGNPDLIVFTDQAAYSTEDIAARPGWDGISAVSNNRIVQVNADIASRWGPRIIEFMQAIVDVLAPA